MNGHAGSPRRGVEVPFFKPSIGPEEEEAVLRILRSGWLTTGKETKAFEEDFSRFVGCPHCLGVNSATSGLLLTYQAFGIGPGTILVTTPYTFVSTATMALHLGAEVVYADVEANGYNIDPLAVEARLEAARKSGRKTAAVVAVHIGGLCANMGALQDLGRRYRVPIIEDAAHAFPAKTAAGYAGTLADAGIFSFYATKTLTTGEGGMVCVKDAAAAERISRLRSHGIDRPVWDRYTSTKAPWAYDVTDLGWKANLPDLLAALGRVQLAKSPALLEQRRVVVNAYNSAFVDKDYLRLPPDGGGNAWHIYLLRIVPEKLTIGRDEFARLLQDRGIGISMHFIPHFRFTWFRQNSALDASDFPHAARQADTTITLPLWPDMTVTMVQGVIDAVTDIGEGYRVKTLSGFPGGSRGR